MLKRKRRHFEMCRDTRNRSYHYESTFIIFDYIIKHHPLFEELLFPAFAKSKTLNVVLRYTWLYKAFRGCNIPIPFLPYPGIITLLTALFNRPVVLALCVRIKRSLMK